MKAKYRTFRCMVCLKEYVISDRDYKKLRESDVSSDFELWNAVISGNCINCNNNSIKEVMEVGDEV